jgi:asparagine synthase (glutamine-hydrolysing)
MFFDNQASLGSMGRDAAAELIGYLGHTGRLLSRAMSSMGNAELTSGTHLPPPPEPDLADLSLSALQDDMRRAWLPEEILHKMDHLSMAHGLEARVPFVSANLFQQLAVCPDDILFGRKGDKPLLKAVAERERLAAAHRRKLAFQLPVETHWRKPIQLLCRQWLSVDAIRKHGVLKESFVKERLGYLEKGEFLAGKQLTSMIALHAWMEENQAEL